jgi:hypothetical protein
MRYVYHTFRPTETIDAVIRLLGRHNLTKAELVPLRRAFDELNGLVVPKPGMRYKIPCPFEVTDDHGNVVDVTPAVPIEAPDVSGSPSGITS